MTFDLEIGSCTVAEVMGTDLFTLTPDTAVASARHLVTESGVSHLLVLENGTLAGIVCGDDLRHADRDARVGDCMTSPVLCVTPDTTLQEAVDIMGANDIDCLPVVTGAYLVGMVTRAALATADLWLSAGEESVGDGVDDGADSEDSDDADETLEAAACAACAATDDVAANGARTGLPLCARCRRLIETNRRC